MHLTVVSSCESKFTADILKKKTNSIERTPVRRETEFITGVPKPNYVCETQPVKQGKLVMGFRTGMRNADDNDAAMRVAVDIFGGGTYSKLFSVVREKMSLCYYCSARLYREKGIVAIQSGIEAENRQKVLDEIAAQLEIMKRGEFTDEEFVASKTAICDSLRGIFDTPDGIDSYISSKIDDDINSIEESNQIFSS